jgi:hypothetical protein
MFRFPYPASSKPFRPTGVTNQTVSRSFQGKLICNESLVNLRLISRCAQHRPGLVTVEKPT